MTLQPDVDMNHLGEAILGECPYCHLPIYQSDPRRQRGVPPGSAMHLYHAGCAMIVEGDFWEGNLQADAQRLRGCGYIVELKIIRPTR